MIWFWLKAAGVIAVTFFAVVGFSTVASLVLLGWFTKHEVTR